MLLTPKMVDESVAFLKASGFQDTTVGIVMGTGLNAMAGKMKDPISISFSAIPNFPEPTVAFHQGQLLFGTIGEKKLIAMQGRYHYYEGYSMQQISFPVRVMKEMGVQTLFLSNASGGLNLSFRKGDLVLIDDHINLLPDNPLRGINDPVFGQRFVDMSLPYDPALIRLIEKYADSQKIVIRKGIYVSVMGPNLETRAEYRWLRSTGADMVGMSTVPEVIVANQLGIKCAAISVITDECDPDNLKPVNIAEIIEVAGKSDITLSNLLEAVIKDL